MSIGKAAVITIVSVILVTLSTYGVVQASLSAGMTRLLAVVSLLSLVALVYGLIELSLAVIATTADGGEKQEKLRSAAKEIAPENRLRINKKAPLSGGAFISCGVRLPAIVRERFVGFGHPVGVFLLLDRVALALAGGDHFGGELLRHRLLVAAA